MKNINGQAPAVKNMHGQVSQSLTTGGLTDHGHGTKYIRW